MTRLPHLPASPNSARGAATFALLPCCSGSAKGNIAMKTIAACFHTALYRLLRNPVLTAMMVYTAVFGVTALMAALTVWRASSSCPVLHRPEPYLLQSDKQAAAQRILAS
jgi:hypothetical protein